MFLTSIHVHVDRILQENIRDFYGSNVSQKKRKTFETNSALRISKARILKTVSLYFRYVQLGSVIHPILIGHSFLSKQGLYFRKAFSSCHQPSKPGENNKQGSRRSPSKK